MIPNDQIPKVEQVVSGGGVTEISFPFYVVDSATVYVLVDGVPVSSGWHVELNSYVPESEDEEEPEEPVSSEYEVETGRVVFDSAVVAGATVTVYRSTPMTQDVALGQGSSFYPQVIEESLDKVVMGMQELRGGTVNTPGSDVPSAGYASSAGFADAAGYADAAGSAGSADLALTLDGGFVVNSASHATSTAGLDSGVVVDSAVYATYATHATTADGAAFATSAASAGVAGALVAGATVGYAESAGSANVASSLTSAAKADIIASAGGGCGGGALEPEWSSMYALNVSVEGGVQYVYTNKSTYDQEYPIVDSGFGGFVIGCVRLTNFEGFPHFWLNVGADTDNMDTVTLKAIIPDVSGQSTCEVQVYAPIGHDSVFALVVDGATPSTVHGDPPGVPTLFYVPYKPIQV